MSLKNPYETAPSIAVLTDLPNSAVTEALAIRMRSFTAKNSGLSNVVTTLESPEPDICGHKLLVALIGKKANAPDTLERNERTLHGLLGEWLKARHKPVLLIGSDVSDQLQESFMRWAGEKNLPAELRLAVIFSPDLVFSETFDCKINAALEIADAHGAALRSSVPHAQYA